MKNRRLPALAVALALSISVYPVSALEGTVQSTESNLLIPGFVYTNRVAETSGGRVESFTVAVAPSSTAYPIVIQGSGLVYDKANIEKTVAYAESLGYNVLGAVNSDYFSLSTGVPTGIVIEDGVYKSSPSHYSSILFNGAETTVLGDITIPITVTNHRSGQVTEVEHLNKYRMDSGGLYLLTDDFSTSTRTSTDGIMVRMVPTYEEIHGESKGNLTVNSSIKLTVTETIETADPWLLEEHHFVLTAAHSSGFREVLEDFQVGDSITITTTTDNEALQNAQWATGGGDIMVQDGALTSSSAWEHTTDGRNPRSAFGVKEDGTMVFYAVDGRQTDYSVGLTQKELADHLLDEGCVVAVNLDGGGSTSFSVASMDAPNVLTGAELVNAPSEGTLRSCATFMLLVDPQDPHHVTLESQVENVLVHSALDLGTVVQRDVNETILAAYPTTTTVEALANLGAIESSVDEGGYTNYMYYPMEPGVEQFYMSGYYDLEGTQSVNVITGLSTLDLVDVDTREPITELVLASEQEVFLDFEATIHEMPVFANGAAVSWRVLPAQGVESNEGIGSVNSDGFFIAGTEDCIIEVETGGLTAQVQVSIQNMFEDVPEDHWAYDAIFYLLNNELISGMSDTEYGMGNEIRRGDFVLMLYGALGRPVVSTYSNFSDVSYMDYYYEAISWASEQGVVSGLGDGSFGAASSITREQALLILYKAYGTLNMNVPVTSLTTLSQYEDAKNISSYALQAVAALAAQGVVGDSIETLYPTTPLTRESMALYLFDMLHYSEKELIAPTQFSLHPNEVYLTPGSAYVMLPMLEPMGSGAEITWTSSDPSAVSVDSSGLVRNVFTGTGQPVVTVTGKIGSLSASCIVRCVPEGTETPAVPSLNLPFLKEEEEEVEPETDTEIPDGSALLPTASTGMVVDAPGGLNVRSTPSSEGSVVALLPEEVIVTLHGKTEDNWYQISYQYTDPTTNVITNIQGYVMGSYMEEKVIVGTVVDAEVGLNLRTGAGTAFDVLLKLPNGSQVAVLQVFSDWYKVQVNANGELLIGFVSSDFLEIN